MKTRKLQLGVLAAFLLVPVAACSDSPSASVCIGGTPPSQVCIASDGLISAKGLKPGSIVTIADANGSLTIPVGPDGKLIGGAGVTKGAPGDAPIKTTVTAKGADGKEFSGDIEVPG